MSPAASDTLAGVLDHVTVTRYATPLREGGSLPALVEAAHLLARAPIVLEVIRG